MQNIIERVKAEILGTNNVHLVNDPVLHAWINLVKEPRPSNFSSLQRQKQITNLATKFHLIKWIKTSNNQKEQETNESPMKLSIYILWELRGSSLRSYRIALRRNPARINGLPSLSLPPSLPLSLSLSLRSLCEEEVCGGVRFIEGKYVEGKLWFRILSWSQMFGFYNVMAKKKNFNIKIT